MKYRSHNRIITAFHWYDIMVISLLMKGEFGMRLDSSFYNKYVELFDSYMCKIFGTDIEKTEAICSFENRGFFRLEYKYYPHNYRIVIENDITLFDISIFDDEQASNSLQRICKFKNHLSTECIEEAINLLKAVLLKNEFNFYFYKDGKLYRKNAEGKGSGKTATGRGT